MSGILSWSLCSRTVFRPFFSSTTTVCWPSAVKVSEPAVWPFTSTCSVRGPSVRVYLPSPGRKAKTFGGPDIGHKWTTDIPYKMFAVKK